VAGKIIADIIEAPYDSIRMNVANVTVLTANSSGLTYVPTGNVNINIGGTSANLTMNLLTANGIKFPATQVTSADGNTLDDYEEGTWSPSFSLDSGSASGVSSSGSYTKIGRKVTVTFVISFSSVSAAAINTITNFPFTVHNVTEQSVGSVRENSNTGFQWHIRANANQTTGIIRRYDNAQGLLDGHFFTGSVTYFTS
jgi:hypothetical protein